MPSFHSLHTVTKDIQKYDFIDALRGYAILLVILVHSAQSIAPMSPTLWQLMRGGAYGVQLFYVASALTLCMSWQSRSKQEISPVRNFFLRRFFRIAPMFYLAIAFYVILYGLVPRYWAPNGIEWWFVPLTALFLHGLHPEAINSVVPGGWSIAVEMNFYLVLPFILQRITSMKSAIVFFLFSIVAYGILAPAFEYLLSGMYPGSQQYLVQKFNLMHFFSQLPVFALGICVYFAFIDPAALKRIAAVGSILVILWISLVMLLQSFAIVARLAGSSIAAGAVFALLTLALGVFPVKVFVNKVTTGLGKISFSMYLSHFAVLHYFAQSGIDALFEKGDLSSLLHFLCVVAVTVPLSYLLYVTVERKGILLGGRIIDRLEQGAPAVAAGGRLQ